jgi:hypothetical protein
MPTAIPSTIGPGEGPGKLTYSVSFEGQRVSGEADVQDLWLLDGARPTEVSGWSGVVEGFVAAKVENPKENGALVSVVLPGCCRAVVRRSTLRMIDEASEVHAR